MSAQNWTQLVLVLLTAALVASALGWLPAGRSLFAPAAVVLLGAAALVAALPASLASGRLATTLLVALCGAVAVVGGGPVTTRVFDVVDSAPDRSRSGSPGGSPRGGTTPPADPASPGGPVAATGPDTPTGPGDSVAAAGAILRGGAWIGALERLAVFAGLATGFPEGVAVVLALKGVGRYPDLKASDSAGGTTERFIIGTFASVLWAAGCAGMVALVRR